MLNDYVKQGSTLHRSHTTILITQEEWDSWDNGAKGFTQSYDSQKPQLWIVRHDTVFPVEILTRH